MSDFRCTCSSLHRLCLTPDECDVCAVPANDGPGSDGHHTVTGECFACMVGVATGPESHGDRCGFARPTTDCDCDGCVS